MKDRKTGNIFVKLLGNEKYQGISIPAFSIIISLIAMSLIILIIGKNPLDAFKSLLQGSGILPKPSYAAHKNIFTDFMSMLNSLTPMLFAALAAAVAFKAGLFNIGISGQMLVSGFIATILVGYSKLNGAIAKPLVIIIGIVIGGVMGGLIGFLKHKFNINEVVASIMLNYIAQYVISFFIYSNYVNPVSRQSEYITKASRLTLMNTEIGGIKIDLPLGILLAVAAAFAIKFFLDKTKMGFEIKIVGINTKGAKYAGINVGKNIILTMLLSGALAGLAGVTYYLGYFASIQPRVLTSVGFDAIAVALLGNSNPVGIIFSSLLISIITKGSTYMSSSVGVEQEIASLITGLILLFSACGGYIKYRIKMSKSRGDN